MKRVFNSKVVYMLTGLLIGAVVFGGGVALASNRTVTMTVTYSDVKIVVDGTEITPKDVNGKYVEPFISDGTTYLPVRAVASALGKEVGWDGDTNTVYIGTQPQREENPTQTTEPTAALSVKERMTVHDFDDGTKGIVTKGDAIPGKLANGKDITEENIAAIFAELEAIFPDGTSWGDSKNGGTYYSYLSENFGAGGGCNSWAYMTADLLWGKGSNYTTHNDLYAVKAGDVVHLKNDATGREHWFVVRGVGVTENGNEVIYSCDGNNGGMVRWENYALNYTARSNPNTIIYSFYKK